MLKAFRLTPAHLMTMYEVFHWLRSHEEKLQEKLVIDAVELEVESIKKMLVARRRWTLEILSALLELGGCKEVAGWNEFLWIFTLFCSLNRVELAQAFFLVIQTMSKSPRLHYITAQELQQFYQRFDECPIESFSTQGIDFDKLPLTRYYASDFAELTMRFGQLLNPIIYLQRVIQSHLPSTEFWDSYDRIVAFNRKVTHDFFLIETGKVFVRGEPPFRESCEMLMCDALGAKAANSAQWILRTSHARQGRGVRQVSVWGEQPVPEEIEDILRRKKEREELEKRRDLALAAAKQAVEKGLPNAEALALQARALAEAAPLKPAPKAQSRRGQPRGQEGPATRDPSGQPAGTGPQSGPVVAWSADQPGGSAWSEGVVPTTPQWGQPLRPREGHPMQPVGAAALSGNQHGTTGAQGGNGGSKGGTDAGGVAAATPQPAHNYADLSLYAASMDETDAGPSDVLPPRWMHSATIAPAPQYQKLPQPKTLGRPEWQRTRGTERNGNRDDTLAQCSTRNHVTFTDA